MTWSEDGVMKTEKLSIMEDACLMKNSILGQSAKSFPLPPLHGEFSRQFKLEESNIEVTSIDISAHGSYVVVGCSNGMIILFCTAIIDHSGLFL